VVAKFRVEGFANNYFKKLISIKHLKCENNNARQFLWVYFRLNGFNAILSSFILISFFTITRWFPIKLLLFTFFFFNIFVHIWKNGDAEMIYVYKTFWNTFFTQFDKFELTKKVSFWNFIFWVGDGCCTLSADRHFNWFSKCKRKINLSLLTDIKTFNFSIQKTLSDGFVSYLEVLKTKVIFVCPKCFSF